MLSRLSPFICALLICVSAHAQFESAGSFDEVVSKVASPGPAVDKAKAANTEKFEEKYLDVLRKALGSSGDDLDPNFWANAYQLVFGNRTNDEEAAALAMQLFKGSEGIPAIPYVPISKENPAYVPGPEGDKMVAELDAALAALSAKEKPTKEDYLNVIQKIAPFLRTIAAARMADANGAIVIPAGSKLLYESKPYCLQHNLPAPGNGDAMWLIPSRTLIPKPALPIYEALLKWSETHAADRNVIQTLLWAIRESDERPLTSLTPDQKRVLDSALENGSEKFLEFMGVKPSQPVAKGGSSRRPAPSGDDDSPFAGATTLGDAETGAADLSATKRAIAAKSRENAGIVSYNQDWRDPRNTAAIVQLLENAGRAQGSSGAKPTDAYTQLAPGVVAETSTKGLGGNDGIRTVVVNRSDKPFAFRPQDYVALTRQKRQPFAFTSPSLPDGVDWNKAKQKAQEIVEKASDLLKRKYDPTFKAKNPVWDVLQHDANGNLVCTLDTSIATGPYMPAVSNPDAKSCFVWVNLYGRDGTPIRGLWNVLRPDRVRYRLPRLHAHRRTVLHQ